MNALRTYLADKRKGDFARSLGINPAYLSQILSGTKRPGFDLMVKIERATGGAVSLSSWIAEDAA